VHLLLSVLARAGYRSLWLTVVWLLTGSSQAQLTRTLPEWVLRSWSISDGMPQGTVNDMLQTDNGALWIATFAGLTRFDGLRFRTLDFEALNLPTNRTTGLVSDGVGGLWLLLQSGVVVHLDQDGQELGRTEAPESGLDCIDVQRDHLGRLWLRTGFGVYLLDAGVWRLVLSTTLYGGYHGLVPLADGTMAVVQTDAFSVLGTDGKELVRVPTPCQTNSAAAFGDRIFILGEGQVFEWADGQLTPWRVAGLAPDESVYCAAETGDGRIWLGTSRGPRIVKVQVDGHWVLEEPLLGVMECYRGRSMYADREGNVWIGSHGCGVTRARPRWVDQVDASLANTMSVVAMKDGTVLANTECADVWEYRDEPGKELRRVARRVILPRLGSTDTDPCVYGQLLDTRGRHWVGAENALYCDAGTGATAVLEKTYARYRVFADGGDGVWVAEYEGTLHFFDDVQGLQLTLKLPVGRVYSLLPQADGAVLAGCESSLWRVTRAGLIQRIGEGQADLRGELRWMIPRRDGSVWIASYGNGLLRYADGKVQSLGIERGLVDASLSAALDDGAGRLWLMSNIGLMVLPIQDIEVAFADRHARLVPVVLGPEAGVPEGNYGSPPAVLDTTGRAWFCSIAGLVRVDTRRFPFQALQPTAVVDHIRQGDYSVRPALNLSLPPSDERLRVDYTAFALSAPERVLFEHRLLGHKEDWYPASPERFVEYTRLSPGPYTLELRARNEEGVWSPVTRLEFELLPAWWQTWWFRGTLIVLSALVLFGLHRLRVRIVERDAARLLAAERARTQAEEDASRLRDELAHMSRLSTAGEMASSLAHEVNQPLGAISANAQAARLMVAHGTTGELAEVLSDIARQAHQASEVVRRLRSFLQKQTRERVPVELEPVLRDALQLVRLELRDARVEPTVRTQGRTPAVLADGVQLQQVIINLCKNSCEACLTRGGGGQLELTLAREDNLAVIEVHDDGPGLEPTVAARMFEPYVSTKRDGMGLGLAICRSIIESHGGRLTLVPARMGGVSFRIELPLDGTMVRPPL